MAEERNPLEIIYNELIDFAANYVDRKTEIFLGNRPDKTADTMKRFITIELPAEVKDYAAGNMDFALHTRGILYVYCKAKSNTTLNMQAQTGLAYSVKKGFPYNAEHISATKPSILHEGYDKNGFHVTSITFVLKTKANAFINS